MSEFLPETVTGTVATNEVVTVETNYLLGGMQHVFRFANGRGASVLCHGGSYGGKDGLWEIAVLKADGDLDYSTPITSDVLGWLDVPEVESTLRAIMALPPV